MDNNTTDYDPNWGGLADDDGLPPPTSFGMMDYEPPAAQPIVVATPVQSQPAVVQGSVAVAPGKRVSYIQRSGRQVIKCTQGRGLNNKWRSAST